MLHEQGSTMGDCSRLGCLEGSPYEWGHKQLSGHELGGHAVARAAQRGIVQDWAAMLSLDCPYGRIVGTGDSCANGVPLPFGSRVGVMVLDRLGGFSYNPVNV
jgi:hypothetical protein